MAGDTKFAGISYYLERTPTLNPLSDSDQMNFGTVGSGSLLASLITPLRALTFPKKALKLSPLGTKREPESINCANLSCAQSKLAFSKTNFAILGSAITADLIPTKVVWPSNKIPFSAATLRKICSVINIHHFLWQGLIECQKPRCF